MQRMRKVMLTLVLACCLLALSACPDDGERPYIVYGEEAELPSLG